MHLLPGGGIGYGGEVQCHTISLTSVIKCHGNRSKESKDQVSNNWNFLSMCSLSPVGLCQTAQVRLSLSFSLSLKSPLSDSPVLPLRWYHWLAFWRCPRGSRAFAALRSISRNEGRLSHSAICTTVFRRRDSAARQVLENTSLKMWGRTWWLLVSTCTIISS